ncbi:MAG: hypothetical protein B9S32_09145 [Verrucomicrobia bacterium Tous-C9LFEB]|nr:MAG: hypothetical protein B9S32_09145 [Verrucomicrobia bacterium Tous-C9LFEB]
MKRSLTSRCPSGAFTLVELLVVICIIAVLAALAMTGLQNARLMANKSVCITNLKQMGQAALLYATDNNGDLPPSRTSWSGGGYWSWWLYASPAWNCPYAAPTGRYLKKSPVICPSMLAGNFKSDVFSGGTGYYCTYAANGTICTDGANGKVPIRLSRVTQPARTPLFTELSAYAFAYFSFTRTDADYFRYAHSNAQNFVFVDGHVESLVKAQIPTDSTDVFWTAGLQ